MPEVRWPLHPRPLWGESVLSWLGRIARGYRMDVKTLLWHDLGFTGLLEPLNRNIPEELLLSLSKRTGVPAKRIRAMTLSSWSRLWLTDLVLPSSNDFSLFLPVKKCTKKYSSTILGWAELCGKKMAFLKACPACIEARPPGTLLLVWYFSILLSCPIHRCMLHYCRTYQGSFLGWINNRRLTNDVPQAILEMDKRTWAALMRGKVDLPGGTIRGAVWFGLLRALMDELHRPTSRKSARGAGYVLDIWAALDLSPRAGMRRWRPYELLPNEIQDKTLLAAALAFYWIETRKINLLGKQALLLAPIQRLSRPK